MIVCIAEDRRHFEVPLKLLILSLSRCSPRIPIYLFYPPASESFSLWLKDHSQVELCVDPLPNVYGWNVKPQAILKLLDMCYDDVVWIDSDIIVTQDISNLFGHADDHTFFATEEALWGLYHDFGTLRTRLWGFNIGRTLPFTLNAGVIRATKAHRTILNCWKDILESEAYRNVQKLNWRDRPIHMVSDQDVLTALLASDKFSDVQLKILPRGKHILQYFGLFGYTVFERISSIVRGLPIFIHSQGPKPWDILRTDNRSRTLRTYIEAIYLDLSPYTLVTRRYRKDLAEDASWMSSRFILSGMLRFAGLWYPPLVGLPIAIVADFFRLKKLIISSLRRAIQRA